MINPPGDLSYYQPQNPQEKPRLKKSHPVSEKGKSILDNLSMSAENKPPISKSGSISPPRQPSSPDLPANELSELASEKEIKADLDRKTKGAWTCIQRFVDSQSGGNIYRFRGIKNLTLEQANQIHSSIFPAVQHMPGEKARRPFLIPEPPEEFNAIHILEVDTDDEWFSDSDDEEGDQKYYSSPTLQTLGYKIEVTDEMNIISNFPTIEH